jgi:phosphohistidine phosphatase SixA
MRDGIWRGLAEQACRAAAALLLAMIGVADAGAAEPPEALTRPGATAIMRHALAPGGGDPAGFQLGDCATQRNLDDRGRAQARAVGAALRAAGMRFDRVLTSRWCRCRETAELLDVGPVEALPALDSFFEARHRRDEQTAVLRAVLADLPAGERVMLVTHFVNIAALTGTSVSSGEVLALERRPDGSVEVLAEWLVDP